MTATATATAAVVTATEYITDLVSAGCLQSVPVVILYATELEVGRLHEVNGLTVGHSYEELKLEWLLVVAAAVIT